MKEIASYLDEYSSEGYLKSKEKYEEIYKIKYSKLLEEVSFKKTELLTEKDKLSKEELLLKELLEMEEIKLEEDDLTRKTIDYLDKENIPYAALYQVVEFKEGIDDDTKNKLEEVLYSSGILNTKIFRDEDLRKIENMNISYFKKSSKKKDNLTKYLKAYPNEVFSNEFITSILESISTSDSDVIRLMKIIITLTLLKVILKGDYNSKYIGVLKRKEEHQLLIKEEEEKINAIKEVIRKKELELDTLDTSINTFK